MNKVSITIILILLNITIFAQEKESDINTRFTSNSLFLFNSFEEGTAYFDDGGIAKAKFNYDVVNNQICYSKNNQIFVISNIDEIDSVLIGNKIFKYMDHKILEITYEGKISILLNRKATVVATEKPSGAYGTPSNTSAVTKQTSVYLYTKGGALGVDHANIQDEKDQVIPVDEELYLYIDNDVVPAKTNQIAKKFRSHKSDIKDFIKEKNINLQDKDELIKLVSFLEKFE